MAGNGKAVSGRALNAMKTVEQRLLDCLIWIDEELLGDDVCDPLLVATLAGGGVLLLGAFWLMASTGNGYLSGVILGAGFCLIAKWLRSPDGGGLTEPGSWCRASTAREAQNVRTKGSGVAQKENLSELLCIKQEIKTSYMPDGTRVREFPDGVRTVSRRLSNGDYLLKWQGYCEHDSIELKTAEGTYIELFANGRKVTDLPSGYCYEDMPDGRRRAFTADYVLAAEEAICRSVIEQNILLFETLDLLLTGEHKGGSCPPQLWSSSKEFSCNEDGEALPQASISAA